MGLLTDFYNTVARFFKPQEEDEASKSVATNRLKLVLMQDRTNLTPKILEQMRGELVDLLSKYLEMDKELLELNFEQEGDQVALMLSIPVIRAKDEEEIEEALAAQNNSKEESEEATEEAEEEISEEESDEGDEESEAETENIEDTVTEENIEETHNDESEVCKKSKKSSKQEEVISEV